jgi:GTP cyclohydrolase I
MSIGRIPVADDRLPRQKALELIALNLLIAIGEDPARPGLQQTPTRWARWWMEFMDGDPGDATGDTTFEDASTDQMVLVKGVRVWSLCEHHLLPFWCDLTMGYIPTGRVLGLSKFGRIARRAAGRLNVQERLVKTIADDLQRATGSTNVAVVGSGEHLCMVMRGAKQPHRMMTSEMRGAFRLDGPARQEFFALTRGKGE